MKLLDIQLVKTHFSKLLELFVNRKDVVFTRAEKPVARIQPYVEELKTPRVPGMDKGKVTILPSFDELLEEFKR
jgi:antitoxin (DNA-binding transcriptional repressor) of toxin-antitoxin stability system